MWLEVSIHSSDPSGPDELKFIHIPPFAVNIHSLYLGHTNTELDIAVIKRKASVLTRPAEVVTSKAIDFVSQAENHKSCPAGISDAQLTTALAIGEENGWTVD